MRFFMWYDSNVTRVNFEKRKDDVENIIMELGDETVEIQPPYAQKQPLIAAICQKILFQPDRFISLEMHISELMRCYSMRNRLLY